MRSWRVSAAYRIAFAYFGAYAIGLAALGAVIFAITAVSLNRELDRMVSAEASTLLEEHRSGGDQELSEAIVEREHSLSATRMLYAVFAADGHRIAGQFVTSRPAVTGLQDIRFDDPREGSDTARGMVISLGRGELLVVAVDGDWLERIETTVIEVFAAAFVGACLLGFAGAMILGGFLNRRLRSISASAEAIIRGDIRHRIPVSPRHDEFDQLAGTLNRMLDRIEGLLSSLREVSSEVAHDLRTPLTQLRARLERAASVQFDDPAGAIFDDALRRVDDVLSLFAAILRVAEVESGETRRFFERFDVSRLLTDLAESFAPSIADNGRALFWSIEPGGWMDGDRQLLAQAVVNLLENAQRHTPGGTVIRLTMVKADAWLCIRVADDGPGVPKSDLHRIVRRFARLEQSRNTAGHGLGLSLVRAVAALHGGSLILTSANPGLVATIEAPAASGPPSPTLEKSGH